MFSSRHASSWIQGKLRQHKTHRQLYALFSSSKKPPPEGGVAECARDLSLLGNRITEQAGESNPIAKEIARQLSPDARREIAHARKKLMDEQKLRKASNASSEGNGVPEPSPQDLRLYAMSQGIPFIGFGIMDNAILILAGDAIDLSLGVVLGISTLCAAALGNIISDLAGVMLGTVIEEWCAKLGLPTPNFSNAQRQLRSVRMNGQIGVAVGLTVGCIIGMFPLLFIDSGMAEKKKKLANMDSIFNDVVTEAKDLLRAEKTSLYFLLDANSSSKGVEAGDGRYFCDKYVGGSQNQECRVPLEHDWKSRVVRTGNSVIINDLQSEPGLETRALGKEAKNMICVPVFNASGEVIAVIQAINKDGGFGPADMHTLQALASHISVYLSSVDEKNEELSLKDTIRLLKDHIGEESEGAERVFRRSKTMYS